MIKSTKSIAVTSLGSAVETFGLLSVVILCGLTLQLRHVQWMALLQGRAE